MTAKRPPAAALPSTVELGPFRYLVSTSESLRFRAQEEQSSRLFGQTDHNALQILLDPRNAGGVIRETFLHELLHVVAEVAGLSYQWAEEEEPTIRRLSPLLLELLRRNPAVVAYLVEADE